MNYYAGIGSRKTPGPILKVMKEIAIYLAECGYGLRSGAAKGADTAFEQGCDLVKGHKSIFKSGDAADWAYEEVKLYFPVDRNPKHFDRWKPYIKGLLARNMMQIFGPDAASPVDFVVCWTPSTNYLKSDCGGTGYAIRAALANDIEVYNLVREEDMKKLGAVLVDLKKSEKYEPEYNEGFQKGSK